MTWPQAQMNIMSDQQTLMTASPALFSIVQQLKLNNTIFILLPGNHTLKRPLQVGNIKNVFIKGLFDSDSVIIKLEITPDFVSSHLVWAFIQMKNAVSIKIANKTMRFTKKGAIIVWLDTCTDVEIKVVKILGVPSEGAMGLCVTNSNNYCGHQFSYQEYELWHIL